MFDNNFVNNNKKSYPIEYVCVFSLAKTKLIIFLFDFKKIHIVDTYNIHKELRSLYYRYKFLSQYLKFQRKY